MDLIIPTYGRASWSQQHTLRQLIADKLMPTLVVQQREVPDYHWYDGDVHVLPSNIQAISETRDYILHDMRGDKKILVMDDDLHFAVRRQDDPTKFRKLEEGDLRRMVFEADVALSQRPHMGIGAREGGNRNTDRYMWNSRLMRVHGFRRDILQKHLITFAPMVVMEDFHVTLQVLRAGYDVMILNEWVSNQAGGSNAPGGCSSYRTEAVQTAAAHKLAALHPGLVRVVQKATKTAWGGGTRTDVVISWKKARDYDQDR